MITLASEPTKSQSKYIQVCKQGKDWLWFSFWLDDDDVDDDDDDDDDHNDDDDGEDDDDHNNNLIIIMMMMILYLYSAIAITIQ